jgi:hypothetical protein
MIVNPERTGMMGIGRKPLLSTRRKLLWTKATALVWNLVFALALWGFAMLGPICAQGQEQSFPTPATSGVLGRKDAGAFAEIRAHLSAVSASGWQSLEATGTLTYPGGDTHVATLYLMGSNDSRLDIEMEAGTRSLRQSGFVARFQHENGNRGSLPPATASAGIVAFPRIWTDAVPSSQISLYDHSTSAHDGHNLHRITIEYPIGAGLGTVLNERTTATDLYFDSSTHVLTQSVDAVTFNGPSRQTFSRETSYADYRQFDGVMIPATIKQYLNGQLQWTLNLSQVNINATLADNIFSF